MNGAELLSLCKDALAEAGEAEAEVFARESARGIARFAVGELGQHMDLVEPQVHVRVAHGRRVAESATSELSRAAIVAAIRDAAQAARHVPESEGFGGFTTEGEPAGPAPERFAAKTAQVTPEERAELLAPALAAIREAGLVSAGVLETTRLAHAVATTGGCARAHDGTVSVFKVWALETPGAGGAAGFGGHMHRDASQLAIAEQTRRAIRMAQLSRDPIALDAGTYDVVMEPEAVSELLEWLSTIAFAAPEIEQGTSPLAGRMGERVTGEAVTIEEDPLAEGDLGFAPPFDREGVWRQKVTLIDRGIARAALYDRTHAARMGARSTGSALLPEFAAPGGVGTSAVGLAAGDAPDVESLIAGLDRGLYVCRLHYVNGYLEPRRAVMTGLTRDGCFLVEKGKITRPVGNLRFTDSFLEALSRADGMTRARAAVPTWWSTAGTCVAPAVRLRAFTFNGKSQVRPSL